MTKPFKGKLWHWIKIVDCPQPEGLGYYIFGWESFVEPTFSPHIWKRTSWVVKKRGSRIETLNSRYELMDESPRSPMTYLNFLEWFHKEQL